MTRLNRLHPQVPGLMTGGLVAAALLAIGHHLFYRSLDRQIVGSSTQQAWMIRIGTGLAILAKALLTASMTFAYTQLMWHALRSRTVTLKGVDSFFGVVGNPLNFTTWVVWAKAPGLVLLAAIIW
jgi:hypothetical protein